MGLFGMFGTLEGRRGFGEKGKALREYFMAYMFGDLILHEHTVVGSSVQG